MAKANNVTVAQLGAQPQVMNDVKKVSDIIAKLDLDNPSIKVNGNTVEADYRLNDFDFVSFGAKVKGGF